MDIELSRRIREAVDGYATTNDLTLDTAYEQLLQQGLDHTIHLPSQPSSEVFTGGSLDEVYYSPIANQRGLHAYTFQHLLPMEDGVKIDTSPSISSIDDFITAVTNVEPLLSHPDRAWFSISNYDGHWYGRGLANFHTALTHPAVRYENEYTGKRHDNETAFLFGDLGEHGYIAIMSQPRLAKSDEWTPDTDAMWRFAVQFLVDDYPLDTSVYEYIIDQFNGELASVSQASYYSVTLRGNEPVEPVELLTESDDISDQGPFVRGAIVHNPLHASSERDSEFEFSPQDQNELSTDDLPYLRETAASLKYVPLRFHGPDLTEEMLSEIRLRSITMTGGMVSSGFGHTNLEVVGTDVD